MPNLFRNFDEVGTRIENGLYLVILRLQGHPTTLLNISIGKLWFSATISWFLLIVKFFWLTCPQGCVGDAEVLLCIFTNCSPSFTKNCHLMGGGSAHVYCTESLIYFWGIPVLNLQFYGFWGPMRPPWDKAYNFYFMVSSIKYTVCTSLCWLF